MVRLDRPAGRSYYSSMPSIPAIVCIASSIASATPGAERRLIFDEDFSDNERGWAKHDDESKAMGVRDGRYFMEIRKPKVDWMVWEKSKLRDDVDYRIETTFRAVRGDKKSIYGLIYGVNGTKDYHAFLLRRDGKYKLYSVKKSEAFGANKWVSSSKIRTGSNVTNDLALEKRGRRFHLFINGEEVETTNVRPLFASRIGFTVYYPQRTEMLKLRVYELGPKPQAPPPPPNNARVVFEDYFYDNRNDWPEGEDDIKLRRVENGHYVFEVRKSDKSWYAWKKKIALRPDRPFIVEAEIEKRSGVQNFAYGLHFGLRDTKNFLGFRLLGDGRYGFGRREEGTYFRLVDYTHSPAIRTGNGATNRIAVRKYGDRFFLFINDELVDRVPAQAFFGERIGFHVYDRQRIHVNSIRVLQWERDVAPRASETPKEPEAKVILAVFEVGDPSGRTKPPVRRQLTEYLGAVLAEKGRFELVPQTTLREQIQNTKKQSYKACYDASCQIELGKAVAAQAVLTTKILRVDKTCVVTSKLFDLVKETTTKAATVETGCRDGQLLKAMGGIAERL